MPAPRRRIPGARRRWSGAAGDPRLGRPDTFAPFPLDIAKLSRGFFFLSFFFSPHWSLMIFPARRELREDWR